MGALELTLIYLLAAVLGVVACRLMKLPPMLGYLVVAFVLLPLYYRHRLTSIYGYLERRLGTGAYRTGAAFFIASRARLRSPA